MHRPALLLGWFTLVSVSSIMSSYGNKQHILSITVTSAADWHALETCLERRATRSQGRAEAVQGIVPKSVCCSFLMPFVSLDVQGLARSFAQGGSLGRLYALRDDNWRFERLGSQHDSFGPSTDELKV